MTDDPYGKPVTAIFSRATGETVAIIEYDAYFDAREKANKIPLSYDAWVKAGKPEY